MADDPQHLDPLERAMLDLSAIQREGVFARTRRPRLEPQALACADAPRRLKPAARQSQRSRLIRLAPAWLSAAACLIVAVGLGRLMLDDGLGEGDVPTMNIAAVTAVSLDWTDFSQCLTGPGRSVRPACGPADFDGDGDVDLADYREFQAAYQTAHP